MGAAIPHKHHFYKWTENECFKMTWRSYIVTFPSLKPNFFNSSLQSLLLLSILVLYGLLFLLFFFLGKLLFQGFLQFKCYFLCGQNNSRCPEWAPLSFHSYHTTELLPKFPSVQSLKLRLLALPMRPDFLSLATNFSCFSLKSLLLVTKSESLGANWPQGCSWKLSSGIHGAVQLL